MQRLIKILTILMLVALLSGCAQEAAVPQVQEPAVKPEAIAPQSPVQTQPTVPEEPVYEDEIVTGEVYGTMEAFASAVENAHSSTYGRSGEETDDASLSELDFYFVADRIPEGYELIHIYVSDICVAYYYYPESKEYSDYGHVPYDFHYIGFQFTFYRWDDHPDNPLYVKMENMNATEADLLEGKYLLNVKSRRYYWAQDGRMLAMQIPEDWDFFVTDVASICHAQTVYVD